MLQTTNVCFYHLVRKEAVEDLLWMRILYRSNVLHSCIQKCCLYCWMNNKHLFCHRCLFNYNGAILFFKRMSKNKWLSVINEGIKWDNMSFNICWPLHVFACSEVWSAEADVDRCLKNTINNGLWMSEKIGFNKKYLNVDLLSTTKTQINQWPKSSIER